MRSGKQKQEPGIDGLLDRIASLPPGGHERRRAELVHAAHEEAGVEPALAGVAYDLAVAEGLDPLLGVELVRAGVGIREFAGDEDTDAPATGAEGPNWTEPPPASQQARRERRLREAFRRLRSRIEEAGDPAAALRAFVAEPDIDATGY
jgi:hypothetical protein